MYIKKLLPSDINYHTHAVLCIHFQSIRFKDEEKMRQMKEK